jgi:glycerol-3-phosphate dehydrogenase (NAD(P)+)
MKNTYSKITILGGGNWGTALAVHVARKADSVHIWEISDENRESINDKRKSLYLPQIYLSDKIQAIESLEESVINTNVLIFAIPSKFAEGTFKKLERLNCTYPIVIATKGFAPNLELISEIIDPYTTANIYTLYGPNIALEVAEEKLSGAVLGGPKCKERDYIEYLFESRDFVIDTSTDIVGLQIASALKNIVTIFVGILEGMKMGENTKAYIFVRGLYDIVEIVEAMGGKRESVLGLSGLGDLLLKSRNRELGIKIGQGTTIDRIEDAKNLEGLIALDNAIKLGQKLKLKIPLIRALHKYLYKGADIRELLIKL